MVKNAIGVGHGGTVLYSDTWYSDGTGIANSELEAFFGDDFESFTDCLTPAEHCNAQWIAMLNEWLVAHRYGYIKAVDVDVDFENDECLKWRFEAA